MKSSKRYRWFVVAIFFFFMLLHQSDKLLIGPLTPEIIAEFGITKTQLVILSSLLTTNHFSRGVTCLNFTS
ncbi:MAG: hypothetical protein MUO62_09000 [Anaerolineales bacterium]|nr:hypothetical protein [Anaerolineales bacterium]